MVDRNNLNRIKGILSAKQGAEVPKFTVGGEKRHLTFEDKEKQQQIEFLHTLINRLDILEKSLVLLWLEDLSYEEIASITGLSISNVGVKLSRIKEKLKKMSNQ